MEEQKEHEADKKSLHYTQQRIASVGNDGFILEKEEVDAYEHEDTLEKYFSTDILSPGISSQAIISAERLTEEIIASNEGRLMMPNDMKTKDDLIFDSMELYQQYVRPEQDLLDFNNDDQTIIIDFFEQAERILMIQ